MSRVTKAELAAKVAWLEEEIKGRDQTIAVTVSEREEARRAARTAQDSADDTMRYVAHYKAQRDTLIGYVEGGRKERERQLASGGPVIDPVFGGVMESARDARRTLVDAFLDDMRREP